MLLDDTALVAFTISYLSSDPLDTTDFPDQATSQPLPRQDLYSVLTDAGERFIGGQPLNITPVVVPELVNEPAVPDENETSPDEEDVAVVPDYDDDELFGLIENSSTSLMLLAVKVSHALYSWDERSVCDAASLQAFAKRDSQERRETGGL